MRREEMEWDEMRWNEMRWNDQCCRWKKLRFYKLWNHPPNLEALINWRTSAGHLDEVSNNKRIFYTSTFFTLPPTSSLQKRRSSFFFFEYLYLLRPSCLKTFPFFFSVFLYRRTTFFLPSTKLVIVFVLFSKINVKVSRSNINRYHRHIIGCFVQFFLMILILSMSWLSSSSSLSFFCHHRWLI